MHTQGLNKGTRLPPNKENKAALPSTGSQPKGKTWPGDGAGLAGSRRPEASAKQKHRKIPSRTSARPGPAYRT